MIVCIHLDIIRNILIGSFIKQNSMFAKHNFNLESP